MFDVERGRVLDVLCSHYYDLQILCSDYNVDLPISEDYGHIRNYLNDNLHEVLECIEKCYCGEIVEKIRKSNEVQRSK